MFTRERASLINLVSLYDKVSHLVNQGKPLDVNHFWISAKLLVLFLTVSHRMPGIQLGSYMMLWVSGWLMGRAQGWAGNGVTHLRLVARHCRALFGGHFFSAMQPKGMALSCVRWKLGEGSAPAGAHGVFGQHSEK